MEGVEVATMETDTETVQKAITMGTVVLAMMVGWDRHADITRRFREAGNRVLPEILNACESY